MAVVGADNKVDIRPVSVGERIGSDWIISQGLQTGEQVIAEGTQKVRAGVSVNPKPFVAEPAAVGTPGIPAGKPGATSEEKPAAPANKG